MVKTNRQYMSMEFKEGWLRSLVGMKLLEIDDVLDHSLGLGLVISYSMII